MSGSRPPDPHLQETPYWGRELAIGVSRMGNDVQTTSLARSVEEKPVSAAISALRLVFRTVLDFAFRCAAPRDCAHRGALECAALRPADFRAERQRQQNESHSKFFPAPNRTAKACEWQRKFLETIGF